MKKFLSTIVLLHFVVLCFSQPAAITGYAAAEIAESLKKNADAVYRLDEAVVEVISPSKYTEKVHQVVTVLNREGAKHLQQSIWFDKFNSVEDIEVRMYNSDGNETGRYKKKDFTIQNYHDGFSLATDDKMMSLSLSAQAYPVTIDVRYTKAVSSYIELPNWYMNNMASSVEQFRYIVKVPLELGIRHRTVNMELAPVISDSGKLKVYTWETKNVGVKKVLAGGYNGSKYLPSVEVSPVQFEYDGYKGDFKSWNDFGKWCYSLYENKGAFTEQRTAEIKAMISGLPDDKSKVKVLYDYLKKNMRYVSIQFGIGGFKPFATKFVDEKKYGDCKALTNYMRSMLTVAGINSYPALINAGYTDAPVSPEFPQNVFNHVILCVPGQKDSTWLECTSNDNEAGFLGSFTENKNALLLTEKGGVMVATPKSNYNQNVLSTVNEVFLNEEGGAKVTSSLAGTGTYYDLLSSISQMETGRQNELFVNYLHYKEPDQFQLNFQNAETKDKVNLKFVYNKLFDFKAGEKYFFQKSISKLCTEKLGADDTRKIEYVFESPYKKIDTTVFHLPAGFKADNLLQNKEFTTDLVYYKREVSYDQAANTIKIISNLFLKNNIIQPEQFNNVSSMFDAIEKEEGNKLVLVRL